MGLRARSLGYRKELEAIEDTEARKEEMKTRCAKTTAAKPSTLQRPLKSTRHRPQRYWPLIMAGLKSTLNPCLAKAKNGRLSILGE